MDEDKDKGTVVPNPAETGAPELSEEEKKHQAEKARKEQELKELNTATELASAELRRIREEKRNAKREAKTQTPVEDERQIDLSDPDAKAWDKHIRSQVSPLQEEEEKAKTEVRNFALETFLKGKPALARDPEKVKELMQIYDRIKTASERTQEGVLADLGKAYGAIYYEQTQRQSFNQRQQEIQQDILASDIGVDRGSTGYPQDKTSHGKLSADQKAVLARWGMSEEEWWKDKQKYSE